DWETPTKKNITSSRSFGHLLSDKEQIAEALSNYTATCALKLRRQGTCCRDLSVFVHTNPHRTELPQYSRSVTIRLDTPANDTGTLIAMAIKGLNLIFKPGFLYLKAGVVVSDFVPESTVQQNLFT